jgi:hypothetical protein
VTRRHHARRAGVSLLMTAALAVPAGTAATAQGADPAPAEGSGGQEPDARRGTLTVEQRARGAAAYPGAGAPADAGDFTLKAGTPLNKRVAKLDAALHKQGVRKLLDEANNRLRSGGSCPDPFGTGDRGKAPLLPTNKYCFGDDDSLSKEWTPQAITGVSDAQRDEQWGGAARPILTGWYDDYNKGRSNGCDDKNDTDVCNEKGVRVTFVDPVSRKYRHVLLVWPYKNKKKHWSFDAVHAKDNARKRQTGIHTGGMVWYGNHLYVADTYNGIRVFDMRKIMDLNPDGDASTNDRTQDGLKSNVRNKMKIGRQKNVWYSFGYRYVMPQVASFKFTATQYNNDSKNKRVRQACADHGAPKASYLSLDRSGTDRMILGEYCLSYPQGDLPSTGRVGAFRAADLEKLTGTATAGATFFLPQEKIQGAARYGGRWYFNQSNAFDNGHLWRAEVDDAGNLSTTGDEIRTATGPEDFYYEHGTATGLAPRLWSVSEHRPNHPKDQGGCEDTTPCGRVIYSHLVSAIQAQP